MFYGEVLPPPFSVCSGYGLTGMVLRLDHAVRQETDVG